MAHRNPEQVARLAKRLAPHYVFVHIDSKVKDEVFNNFVYLLKDCQHVKFIDRHRSAWASWGIVEAILEGVKAALSYDDWSHVMVLSGQDYPLMSSEQMEDFFQDHTGMSFAPNWSLPNKVWGNDGGMYRVRYWHMPFKGRRVFFPIARKQPEGIKHAGGSMFSCLSRKVASEVIAFTNKMPKVVNFYRHVWIPDEMYIPTVVMNSEYKDSVYNENLIYIRWTKFGSPHPDNLTVEDGSELLRASREGSTGTGGRSRRKLFARKISLETDSKLLDLLDQAAIANQKK